LVSKVIKLQV